MTVNTEALADMIMKAIKNGANVPDNKNNMEIPMGISNRHIHLSERDLAACFGGDYQLQQLKDLSQPGQYAAKETVTICGPRGAIEKVRVLGPVRKQTQAEILAGDCFKLGIRPYVRLSGELAGSAPITVIGPKGAVYLTEGAIVAQRHIHMTPEDAGNYQVTDQQLVSIRCHGERGGILEQVAIRVTNESALECHLDIEEANAMGLSAKSIITIVT